MPPTFQTLRTLLTQHPTPLLPPGHTLLPSLTSQISSLLLHPTLETALHILNHDLPSAHFLVRHMQSAPAYEGMYLHGILHRIEGDYDNSRMWYSDVRLSDVYKLIWGEGGMGWKEWRGKEEDGRGRGLLDEGQRFIDSIQEFKEGKGKSDGEKERLEGESRREIEGVLNFCVKKFGTERWEDASSAWVRSSDDIKKMGEDQVSGDGGRRKF